MSSISNLTENLVMVKLKPTWQGIPNDVKKEIVQYLDYKSRFRLSVCSKSDQYLVDNCPISLEQVEIYLTSIRENANLSKLHIKNGTDVVENIKNPIEHFFGIFKSKSSTVQSVIFGFNPSDAIQNLKMLSITESFTKVTKVRAASVYFKTNGESCEEFLKIFGIFDAKHLKSISFRQIVSPQLVEQLVETDGWKNVKEIYFYGQQNVPIDTVLHLDKMRFSLNNLTAENAWKLIDSFITRQKINDGFGFRITYSCDLTEEQIVSEFKVPPTVVPNLMYQHENQNKQSYHFATKSCGTIFIVKMRLSGFGCRDFEAYACSSGDLDEEFRSYGSWAPSDHIQANRRIHNGVSLRIVNRRYFQN